MAVPARIEIGLAERAEHGEGIELRDLAKSYRAGDSVVPAVRGIDVSIAPRETVAILGPNGAGKSTAIDMLLGLAEPDAGTVSVFGQEPAAVIRAGRVGAMLQTGSLLRDLTVRELVAMMAALFPRPLDVDEVLEVTGIAGVAGQSTQRLSGGQAQRVRFALALVPDPELLVLDEPTVGMDVEGRHAFWTTMRDFAARGRTVLFATHYLEEADAYADRIVLMARGSIVADGPPTEIKAMVGSRTIRATLPHASAAELERLPCVTRAELHGESVILVCSDSDRAIRALLERFPAARDLEITGAGLEEAFLQLTGEQREGGGVNRAAYIRFELLRTVRNRRFFILALGFPIVLYFLIAGPNRNEDNLGGSGLSAPLYYMVGLAAFGAMNAMLSVGGRIATERTAGWNRQLRLTPLSPGDYFRAKILTGYMTAVAALILLYVAGATLGVRLGGHEWLEMTGLILVGLIPFGALAILFGHLLTADAIGPAMGGLVAVLAVLGGVWFPLTSGALYYIGRALPSYWLVQASHVAVGGQGWGRTGWLIVLGWSVLLAVLARRAYRRDTARV